MSELCEAILGSPKPSYIQSNDLLGTLGSRRPKFKNKDRSRPKSAVLSAKKMKKLIKKSNY